MPDTSKLSRYLKPEHVKDGDIITFLDAGIIEFKDFKQKDGTIKTTPVLEMNVEINGERKIYSPNGTTVRILNDAWGMLTEAWAGCQGRITIIPNTQGKDMIVCKPV